jgi:YD repeat-containing protein
VAKPGSVLQIDKAGVIYNRQSSLQPIFLQDTYRVTALGPDLSPTGCRFEDKSGSWKEFEPVGTNSARMTSYGTRTGLVGRLIYESGGNGKLVGILDRNNRQVLWFDCDGGGALRAARDLTGRRVEYTYTGGRLSRVRDLLGNDTLYTYNGKGRLTKLVDAAGRERTISYDSYGTVASVVDAAGNGFFFDYDFDAGKKEGYARLRSSAGMVKEIWLDQDWEVKRVDVSGSLLPTL